MFTVNHQKKVISQDLQFKRVFEQLFKVVGHLCFAKDLLAGFKIEKKPRGSSSLQT